MWRVIEAKWPGFEEAFLGFEPEKLNFRPDEFWEGLARDKRIVRNPQKIKAIRHNAAFVVDIAREHGSFGAFLADWPSADQIGLLDFLAKRGARLGGRTGQYLLRFTGKDGFIVAMSWRACGTPDWIFPARAPEGAEENPVQRLGRETGLPFTHLSRICAISVGENTMPRPCVDAAPRG